MAACLARVVPRSWLKLVKYASVSLIATGTSLTILAALVGIFDLPSVWSNVVATAVGTFPSFELNRRWVWSLGGSKPTLRQIVPFSALSFTGLAASSIAVHFASNWTMASSHMMHTAAVEGANIATFGALWLVQYAVCNRLLFAQRSNRVAAGTDLRIS
jgi:putative flippase GtrA